MKVAFQTPGSLQSNTKALTTLRQSILLNRRSRASGRSLGAGGAVWLGDVSIASCGALDTRSCERFIRNVGFLSRHETLEATSPEVDGPF
nr:uncharacterized protein LOC126544247 isoform X5 [Dermacentor andersoni]